VIFFKRNVTSEQAELMLTTNEFTTCHRFSTGRIGKGGHHFLVALFSERLGNQMKNQSMQHSKDQSNHINKGRKRGPHDE